MKSLPLTLTLAGVLTLGVSATAMAQSWYPGYTSAQPQYGTPSDVNPQDQAAYEQQQQQYQDAQQSYEDQRAQYRNQQSQYHNQRSAYDARTNVWRERRNAYDADRDAYERQRAEYDAQYGRGAWERRYGYNDDNY